MKKDKKPVQKQKETVATLVKRLLDQGMKVEAVRKAASDYLEKNTDAKTALHFYAQRMSYRAVRRALKTKEG